MSSVSTLSLRAKEGIKFVGPSSNLAQVVLRMDSHSFNKDQFPMASDPLVGTEDTSE